MRQCEFCENYYCTDESDVSAQAMCGKNHYVHRYVKWCPDYKFNFWQCLFYYLEI
jgi:hypothetical protein